MDKAYLTFDEVKKMYPDESILFSNPEMKNKAVLGGVVVYHSKDKKQCHYYDYPRSCRTSCG